MTKTIKPSKWRTVIHRDGRKASAYEVSEDGEVRSYLPTGYSTELLSEPRLLKGHIRTAGYRRFSILFDDGRRHHMDVHVFVCRAFNGPPPPGKNLVRHIDGNKLNNHFSNLMWGDAKDNAADAVKHGTAGSPWHAPVIAEDLPGEVWMPIRFKPTDKEQAYWVSNLGRMKSYKKQGPAKGRRKDAVLLRGVKSNGYWVHNLKDAEGKKHRKGTHQWVLWAFEGPPPPDKPYVLHKDDDKNNNTLSNLEYGSANENSQDASRNMSRSHCTEGDLFAMIAQRSLGYEVAEIADGFRVPESTVRNILSGNSYSVITGIQYKRQGGRSGEEHYQAKLTDETVAKALHDVLVEDKPQVEVARALGVTKETLNQVILNKTWKHVPRPVDRRKPKGLTEAKAMQALHDVLVKKKSKRSVARAFGVRKGTIDFLVAGETWKDLPRPTSTATTGPKDLPKTTNPEN